MKRLLNSAVMPAEGTYTLRRVSQEEFTAAVREAAQAGMLESYIGYQQTADHVAALAGVEVAVNRDQTPVDNGDTLLICKLPYRVAEPGGKGKPVPEEFEYFLCEYRI